jgi:phosphoribosylaminoimidazolecarboxamide formyltransferase/IMP cyclohydrolase
MDLRYGINPHQAGARADPVSPGRPPFRLLHGTPSYINVLDALNGWQLVHEASRSLGRPAAASFKHVSPAGVAVAGPVDEVTAGLYGAGAGGTGPLARAYLRARDADPKSSYGDVAALSHPVDAETAELLASVVSDGVIAPGYAPGTVGRLARKKEGRFLIMEADGMFTPPAREAREVFGLRMVADRDRVPLSPATLGNVTGNPLPGRAADDLLLGLVTLRYTQSNSVCYVRGGMTLGIGAGQQSRVDCTRLAGAKADTWWLRRPCAHLPARHPAPGPHQLAGPVHRGRSHPG